MTQVLFIVGVIVFFITVCGSIMVGWYLLEELAKAGLTPEPEPLGVRSVGTVATSTVSS